MNSPSSTPSAPLKRPMGGIVASPTPTVPISGDSMIWMDSASPRSLQAWAMPPEGRVIACRCDEMQGQEIPDPIMLGDRQPVVFLRAGAIESGRESRKEAQETRNAGLQQLQFGGFQGPGPARAQE